jgi:hypothetical protein
MSASLKKFTSRAPRYTLRPNDNHYMRFAHKEDAGKVQTTRFVDISLTGLAFITDRDNAPFIYEMIKVEIPLAGGEHVAWWAKVVRIEEYSPQKWYLNKENFKHEHDVLVGVQFQNLPLTHLNKIKETIDRKFAEAETENRRERLKNLSAVWAHYSWQLLFYVACTIFVFWLLWHFAQPDPAYDPSRGTPWGERFLKWPFGNQEFAPFDKDMPEKKK